MLGYFKTNNTWINCTNEMAKDRAKVNATAKAKTKTNNTANSKIKANTTAKFNY